MEEEIRCSLVCLLILITAWTIRAEIQCQNQYGKPVDWFIVYKLPKIRHESGTTFGEGLAMYYLDVDNPTWTLSKQPINSTSQSIYFTLQQIYGSKEEDNLMYIAYNDEKPEGQLTLNHGHSKGVVAFDLQSGYWLIHSAPKFPPKKSDGYKWAKSASDYGQSFLCVSFSYKSLGSIATQLQFNYPWIYDYNLPAGVAKDFPTLSSVINGKKIQSPPYYSVQDVYSLGGGQFRSFAKCAEFGADLYDALVAPNLKYPVLVETWHHGAKALDLSSNCSISYSVYNIIEVSLLDSHWFDDMKDHSKFVVSLSAGNWVCIGDINRQMSQFKRGGGTLCFQNPDVWKTYIKSVIFFEPCKQG